MNILVTMAAIAFTLGIGGQAEVWTVTDPPVGFEHVPHETVIEQPAQCVTAGIIWDGSPRLENGLDWVYDGGIEPGMIRLTIVGRYVWVAVGYTAQTDSRDMVIWSVPVVDGDEQVTACLP